MNCTHFYTKPIHSGSFRGRSKRHYTPSPACDLMDESRETEIKVKDGLKENGVEVKAGKACPVAENKEWDKCPFYESR